jgi:hypothetical protein
MTSEPHVLPLAVDERVAAKMLSVSVAALRRWRREKKGPKFARLSRCVRYAVQDLEKFLNENMQASSVPRGQPGQEFVPIGTRAGESRQTKEER